MLRFRSLRLLRPVPLVLVAVLAGSCQRAEPPRDVDATRDAPDYAPDATIKDLMLAMVDTSADGVWLSVTTEVSEKGIVDTRPVNDEDWTRVRHAAVTLAESANLLMIPGRHVAGPGEKSETPGVELEPHQMEALIEQNRTAWNVRARALHDAAMLAVRAAEAHDAGKVFEVGETIENACESCHRQYWYPNEKVPDPAQF